MRRPLPSFLLLLLLCVPVPALAQEEAPSLSAVERKRVVVVPVRDQIDDPIFFVLRGGLKKAETDGIDTVILDMKTPGGNAAVALEMMEALARFRGETITYVNDEAISAGAFIAAATKEIWFKPQSIIGAAAAVTSGGADIPETMRLKLNSFLRAKVRAVSEGHGYRGEVLSAMIDKDYELKIGEKVIKKPGELLSLTAAEAMETYGTPPEPLLGAGVAADIEALLVKKYGANNYTVEVLQVTWSERLAQHLTNLSPILLGLGMLALFIEFKTPGFGLFGVAALVLLGLVFISSYVAGLSGHEPVLLFAVGFLLLVAEILFFPGVVIAALSGIVMMLGSLVWAMADLWPNEPISLTGGAFVQPLTNVALGLLITAGLAIALLRFMPRGWFWDRMILSSAVGTAAQQSGMSPTTVAAEHDLVGRTGVAMTPLRPYGQVEIAGDRYEAQIRMGSVEAGVAVVVVAKSDFGLIVERSAS